ncbi:platelet endothelial cell adhesion molecule isoform 2-T2 [Clarias gariepinus]|uniref:platelet endothelial cell adhesion molecule isoform X2 n=1 Tax=Clarias gariepinus TaxID=13013 RepID=UPI00234CBB25|nr:platelet endothelial cell adhesion molecule isoform X2 [Clarias gariepinus]
MACWPLWLTVVLICFLTLWQDAKAQPTFTIDLVELTILPGTKVQSGSNLTLYCKVSVSQNTQLIHTLMFLKDETVIYSKNTSDSLLEYSLVPARAGHSGNYKCQVQIFSKERSSKSQRLTVTGLQTPKLKVQAKTVTEGDTHAVTCSAPEEIGGLYFIFYKNDEEFFSGPNKDNTVTLPVKFDSPGKFSFYCKYTLMLHPLAGSSTNSNIVNILVRELEITPSIRISPNTAVVEGDRVHIYCNVSGYSRKDIEVFLTKDTVLLKLDKSFSYSFEVTANASGEYVCKIERDNVQKSSKAKLQVAELFSRPVLTMTPNDVFEDQQFNLSCRSYNISKKQIAPTDVKYSLYKDEKLLTAGHIFSTSASKVSSGNYYCKAEAKGITKASTPLVIKVKVPVSAPVIRTKGKMIIGQQFQLQCESQYGAFPITYTLLKFQKEMKQITLTGPNRIASFNITLSYKNESHSFSCIAENAGGRYKKSSSFLNEPVIETVSIPDLTYDTKDYMVTEGVRLSLICSVQQGTLPITFTWYRSGVAKPLNTTKISKKQGVYIIKSITRENEGRYYCHASNGADVTKSSLQVTIRVNLANWKKALVGVSCILLLVLVVIILIIFLKKAHTPQRRKRAVELSVKPARTKSNDPMRVSLTLDIEDNTTATPGIMGRNVWSDHVSSSESDEEKDNEESEKPQHGGEPLIQNVDNGGGHVMHDTDTVKGEFPDTTQDESDQVHTDPEYVQLNSCQQEPE